MTVNFLNAGQVEDGSLRLRQYLEYKLLEVISRVNIPVPVDFALDDTKKQVQSALDAIQAAVALHQAAGQIVLDAQQLAGLQDACCKHRRKLPDSLRHRFNASLLGLVPPGSRRGHRCLRRVLHLRGSAGKSKQAILPVAFRR